MWELCHGGHIVRWDDLTLAEVEQVEQLAGAPWQDVRPTRSAQHGLAVATVALARFFQDPAAEALSVRLREWQPAEDDLPDMYLDGVPSNPTRETDRWIPQLCPPFTPRQIRQEFTLRDIHLLAAANPNPRR